MTLPTAKTPLVANLPPVTISPRFPLISIELTALILDKSRTAIVNLIDSGGILFAFDIRTRGASRPMFRIYYLCILQIKNSLPVLADNLESVISAALPLTRGNPTGSWLSRVLHCSMDHVTGLADDGFLKRLDTPRRGKGGSPHYSRQSAADFLRQRRVTG
jgi:hypothetical protein